MGRQVARRVRDMFVIAVAWSLVAHAQAPADPSDAFFDDRQVQTISLHINSRDLQSFKDHYLDDTYYPCNFEWNGQTVRNAGIHSRGEGSRSATKPGLRVNFERYVTGQTFLGLRSFVLRNQTQDASYMHEPLTMKLFRRLGVKASREAFAKLYINNNYAGLYVIVESVDNAFLRKSFGEDSGYLYKYEYAANDPPWFFEDRGTNPDAYVPKPFLPETRENDPRPEKIVELVRIVNNDTDAVFPTTVEPYIDWDNFTQHIAVENVVADQDGFNGDYGVNNFYWYRSENKNLFTWIPWDKSEAFKSPSFLPIFHNFLDGDPQKQNRLSRRAMDLPNVRALYLDQLLGAARSLGERDPDNPDDTRGWMEREIQREYDQIRDLVYADTQKPFTNDEFEAEVERLRTFARERPAFVESAVGNARGQ